MNIALRILAVVVLVLVVDGVWLRLQRAMYRKTIRHTQKKEMKLRLSGAVGSYVCIIFLIVFVNEVVLDRDVGITSAALYGFLIGLAVYGVFNGTNVAIFTDYDKRTAIIDSIWGGSLFALSFALYSLMMS